MKKNKGFTLIELLAVIVILALLVLVATPAITNIMQSSAKSNFKNEVMGMVSNMETAFTEKMARKVISVSGETLIDGTNTKLTTGIYNVSVGGKGYAYLCMTLAQLRDEQYMNKNLGDTYGGYIQMWVPDFSGETITFVNTTNGRYFLQGKMNFVSDDRFVASQTAYSANRLDGKSYKATANIECPTEADIPYNKVHNEIDSDFIPTSDEEPDVL